MMSDVFYTSLQSGYCGKSMVRMRDDGGEDDDGADAGEEEDFAMGSSAEYLLTMYMS